MLKFYNSEEDFLDNREVLPVGVSANRWEDICKRHPVRLRAGQNAELEGSPENAEIVLTANFNRPMDARLNAYQSLKQLAMIHGNAAVGAVGVDYSFTGYEHLIYRSGAGQPYLQSIQGVRPSTFGALTLVSGDTVSVTAPAANTIHLELDGFLCDACEKYNELNAFLWRLYHAANELAYKLYNFAPTEGVWGAWPSYQAVVTVWNNLVWKSNYALRVETIREALSMSVGYTANQCSTGPVTIVLEVTLIEGFTPADWPGTSAAELTMFNMGKTQSATDAVKAATTAEIRRIHDRPAPDPPVEWVESGLGNANMVSGYIWSKYRITLTLPSMRQGDSVMWYFTLARGLYGSTELNIPRIDMYPSGEYPHHLVDVKATWNVSGMPAMVKEEKDIKMLALDNIPVQS